MLRRQVTDSLMALHPQGGVDDAIQLWELLANHIVSIVGEDGFDSLYARSLFLAQPELPWDVTNQAVSKTTSRFAELKSLLKKLTHAQVIKANKILLHTFLGILASLIGDELTIGILRSAWGNNASRGRQGAQNE